MFERGSNSRLLWHARNLLGEYCPACLSMQSLKCLDHTLSLPLFSYLGEKIQQNGKKGGKGIWEVAEQEMKCVELLERDRLCRSPLLREE